MDMQISHTISFILIKFILKYIILKLQPKDCVKTLSRLKKLLSSILGICTTARARSLVHESHQVHA